MSVYGYPSSSPSGDGGNQYGFLYEKNGFNFEAREATGESPFAPNGTSTANGWSNQHRQNGLMNGSIVVEQEVDVNATYGQQQFSNGVSLQHPQTQHLKHVILVQQQHPNMDGQSLGAAQYLQPQASPFIPPRSSFTSGGNNIPQSTAPQFNPKIFVGGLSWSSNEVSLQQYFSQFGAVDSVEIMRDRLTGNPRGFAFVIFAQDIAVDRVLAHPKHIIDCKLVDVKRAHARSNFGDVQSSSQPPSKSSSPVTTSTSPTGSCPPLGLGQQMGYSNHIRSSASSPVNSVHTNDSENQNSLKPAVEVQMNKIFIGGLHHAVDREELKNYFSKYGKVCDACVMFDPVTRRSRGFGFITYEADESAQRAISDQVHSFRDKTVELKLAQPKASGPMSGPPPTVTPSKVAGHARAMSTIEFRQAPIVDRAAPQSRGRHMRSSSAGADLIFANGGSMQMHQLSQQGSRLPVENPQMNGGTPSRRSTSHAVSYQPAPSSGNFSTVHLGQSNQQEGSMVLGQIRGTIPASVNVPAPGMGSTTRNGSPAEPQGLSELETALYRRVSQLEGQLASAQADVYIGQQANSQLQEQLHDLEKQVNDTRRSERALISMLSDQGKDGMFFKNGETKSSPTWGDSRWGAPISSGSSDASEADIEKLKSVVTGLNGRLGNHDADVSERLLVSALLAEGQTDRALVDIIVELDERLAIIEDNKAQR